MDEAKRIELLAMLSYRLLAKVKDSASFRLREAVVKGMQNQALLLSSTQRKELFQSTIITGFIARLASMDKYGSVDAAFRAVRNKPALKPLLLRGDVFATAALGLGAEKFSEFLPAQAIEEDTAKILHDQSGAFPDFVKSLI